MSFDAELALDTLILRYSKMNDLLFSIHKNLFSIEDELTKIKGRQDALVADLELVGTAMKSVLGVKNERK